MRVVVIGGGVVGLACAAQITRAGAEVFVLERGARLGQETSSRNSGVIHAGIYYPPGSLKAALCVRGRTLLYERCAAHAIPHRRLGKLIVATRDAEEVVLESLWSRALENGAGDVRLLSRRDVDALESGLDVSSALLSPETGIVLLKRVVAGPGDVVAVGRGRLIIDGVALPLRRDSTGFHELLGQEHRLRLDQNGGPDFGPVVVPADRYLVLGDNRGNSRDGRLFGFVERQAIIGRAIARYWGDHGFEWTVL